MKYKFIMMIMGLLLIGIPDNSKAESMLTNNLNSGESISEYDVYVDIKTSPKARSMNTKEKVDFVLEGGVEKELQERGKLSTAELESMGYNAEDIKVLREYDGTPIEKDVALRSTMARMTTNFNQLKSTDDVQSVKLYWQWNKVPIVTLTDQMGSIFYDAFTRITLLENNNTYPSKFIVDYGAYQNGKYQKHQSIRIRANDYSQYSLIYKFPVRRNNAYGYPIHALRGTMYLSIGTVGRHAIREYHFKSSYAHQRIKLTGVGLGFSGSVPSVAFTVGYDYDETVHRHLVSRGKKGGPFTWTRATDDR